MLSVNGSTLSPRTHVRNSSLSIKVKTWRTLKIIQFKMLRVVPDIVSKMDYRRLNYSPRTTFSSREPNLKFQGDLEFHSFRHQHLRQTLWRHF